MPHDLNQDCVIAFLSITLLNLTKLAAAVHVFLSKFYKPYDFQLATTYVSHFHIGFYTPC